MDTITLSPIVLFLNAGLVGKMVMLVLFLASIWCWIIIIETGFAAFRLKQAIQKARSGDFSGSLEIIPISGKHAIDTQIIGESVGERRQRLVDTMGQGCRRLLSHCDRGLPTLAVIASIAPFIGLLGTVWGIMTSFANIAGSKDTSLAVVAPGIAEALAATAYGLAAAIPASVGYSKLGASFSRSAQDLGEIVEEKAIVLLSAQSSTHQGTK